MYTPFWYNQPTILYEKEYLFEIFPIKEYDIVRKLNALVRFSIYYAVIMYLYNRDTNVISVPLVVCLLSYFIWKRNVGVQSDVVQTNLRNDKPTPDVVGILATNNKPTLSDGENDVCSLPTKDNPFMNTPFFDVAADKELPKSCVSYDNKGIQRKIESEFNKGLYRDYTDIFGKENSQRQFFSVPGRDGIPDQGSFAHWCYRTTDTCKEGNSLACLSGAGTTGVLPKSS